MAPIGATHHAGNDEKPIDASYDEQDKERLTPDEQSILDEIQKDEETLAAEREAALQVDDPAPAAAPDDAATAEDVAAAEPEPAAAAAEPEPAPAAIPEFDEAALTAATQNIETLDQKLVDAFASYNDGDMTDDEYQAEVAATQAARDEAMLARNGLEADKEAYTTAKAATDQQNADLQAKNDELWGATVKDYSLKFPELFSDAHMAQFDLVVQNLTVNPAMVGKSFDEVLETAHHSYAAQTAAMGNPLQIALPGSKGVGNNEPEPPQTLADVPASDLDANADKFTALANRVDNLDNPDDIEAVMSMLPPDQRMAFASFQDG